MPTKIIKRIDGITHIQLNTGQICMIDSFSEPLLEEFQNWMLVNNRVVVQRHIPSQYGFAYERAGLARILTKLPSIELMVPDHIDRNPLNNVVSNLRICTRAGNNRNRSINKNNTTGYKGVVHIKKTNKFVASIGGSRRRVCLGTFSTAKEAALVYDKKARELFGEFAALNFPEEINK